MTTKELNELTIKEMNSLIKNWSEGRWSFASKVAKTVLTNGYYSDKQAVVINEALEILSSGFFEDFELLPTSEAYKAKMELCREIGKKQQFSHLTK